MNNPSHTNAGPLGVMLLNLHHCKRGILHAVVGDQTVIIHCPGGIGPAVLSGAQRELRQGAPPFSGDQVPPVARALQPKSRTQPASAFSIASVSSGSSGATSGAKRPITLPSLPTRNFSKFHSTPGSGLGVMP